MRKMLDHKTKTHIFMILALLTTDVNFAYWPLLQVLLAPNAYLKDGVCKLVGSFAKILFSSLQFKLFDIAQRWIHKDAKHQKLLNLLCIVYITVNLGSLVKHILQCPNSVCNIPKLRAVYLWFWRRCLEELYLIWLWPGPHSHLTLSHLMDASYEIWCHSAYRLLGNILSKYIDLMYLSKVIVVVG